MAPPHLIVEVGQDGGGVTVVSCAGELDVAAVSELADAVAWSLAPDLRRLRIDATNVTFCDSAGLRCLLEAAYQCQRQGARLDLVASDQLSHTLKLCGVPVASNGDGLLADLTDTLTDAITAKVTRSQPGGPRTARSARPDRSIHRTPPPAGA